MTDLASVDAAVDAMLTPLRDTLAKIDNEIAEHEAAIATLKQARAKPARILAAAERTPAKPGPKVSKGSVSEERLDALADWLRANMNGQEFYSTGLIAREDFTIIPSQSHLSKALVALQDRGVIRLDSKGIGGRKVFKLVASE